MTALADTLATAEPGRQRLIKELQTGSPEKIELYFVLAENRIGERDFHRKFADLRLNGEWFRRDGALADFIDYVQAEYRGGQIS